MLSDSECKVTKEILLSTKQEVINRLKELGYDDWAIEERLNELEFNYFINNELMIIDLGIGEEFSSNIKTLNIIKNRCIYSSESYIDIYKMIMKSLN